MALERWTTALQAYYDAGGDDMNDERKKGSILKILPWRIQEQVLWDFDDFKTSDALVRWIKSKVRLTTTWRPTEKEAYLAEDIDEETAREP